MTDILQLLGAGGDLAIIAVLAMLWRFDRRLVRLETLLNGKKKK
jgi:hypothetical protein